MIIYNSIFCGSGCLQFSQHDLSPIEIVRCIKKGTPNPLHEIYIIIYVLIFLKFIIYFSPVLPPIPTLGTKNYFTIKYFTAFVAAQILQEYRSGEKGNYNIL